MHSAEHVALYFREKVKNGLQFFYLFAPFLLTLVGRHRVALAILAAAVAFCAYHVFFTVETMGHHSPSTCRRCCRSWPPARLSHRYGRARHALPRGQGHRPRRPAQRGAHPSSSALAELCERDRPEAIFIPNKYCQSMRQEIARGACFKDYKPALRREGSPLYIRNDLADDFEAALLPKLRPARRR